MSGFRGVGRDPVVLRVTGDSHPPAPDVETQDGLPLRVWSRTIRDLAGWAATNQAAVTRWLDARGAVLFSGFDVRGLQSVEEVVRALAGEALPYLERSTPRTQLAPGVYTSTDYPADQAIPLHNENAYQSVAPARLVFCCLRPATTGGATVLADCRAVLRRIDADVADKFRHRGVGYLRNYIPGLGPSWQEAFQTTDPAAVDRYCAEHAVTADWLGDRLRTWQRRPALGTHRRTGEPVWFNHAVMFHPGSLPQDVAGPLIQQFGNDGLPVQSRYGDGQLIEMDVLSALQAAYAAEAVEMHWNAGDVLLIDNQLVAHGRTAFTGNRQVVVSMTGEVRASSVEDG